MRIDLPQGLEGFGREGGMKNLRVTQLSAWLVFLFLIIFQTAAYSATVYVRPDGNDTNSGATWSLAKKTVTAALVAAAAGDEIWVAAGTYPEHIKINKEVALYGGFRGDEIARGQRDWSSNITILDGGGGDPPPPPLSGTVVQVISNLGPATRLDGFTVTGGHGINGGGIQIVGSAPVISNNIIKRNKTDGYGAGISVTQSNPTTPPQFALITDNVIAENSSVNDVGDGGGIGIVESSPTIRRNIIARNQATRNGGGIACWKKNSPTIESNFILANSANVPLSESTDVSVEDSTGGGGIFASATDLDGEPIEDAVSAPVIINNVIAANGANYGAGICVIDSILPDAVATITNNTVVANNGPGIYWANTSPKITNNLIAFNTWGLEQGSYGLTSSVIKHNNVYRNSVKGKKTDYYGVADQTGIDGNISADPKMANYKIGEFHLQPGSPCINAGETGAVGDGWTDIDGQNRVSGGVVDIGADESDGTLWNVPTPVFHVRTDGNDAQDGLTWATAKKTVTGGIAAAALTGGEVWVAEGTYTERITIPAFVYLYGGFAGNETNREARDISANETILDGGGKPLVAPFIATVVRNINAGYLVSRLDGFTIQNGGFYTGGTPQPWPTGVEGLGGGIYGQISSPYIGNNVVKNNSLGDPFVPYIGKGAGIALYLSYAVISGNTIRDNEILHWGQGGGIYTSNSMPDIDGNTIDHNHADWGSAIFSTGASGLPASERSSPSIRHNLIENNGMYVLTPLYAGSAWGAITVYDCPDFVIEGNVIKGNTASVGGGINVQATFGGNIVNNIVTDNSAVDASGQGGMGGGIYCEVAQYPNDNIYVVNNTITDNDASNVIFGERGGGMAITLLSDKLVIADNIVTFNSSGIWRNPYNSLVSAPHLISHNDVFNAGGNYLHLNGGIDDINVDPDFVNRPAGDFHLKSTSSCIDAGSNSSVPASLTTDFEGNPRMIDGNGDSSAIVDIGAYEFEPTLIIDLIETSVSNPPATAAAGSGFSVTDTTKNQGNVNSGASTTRYYLSADTMKGAGGVLLTGTRPVPALAAGATSIGTLSVTIPSTIAFGTYHLLACADDKGVVMESNETNNCVASASATVIGPDLVVSAFSVPAIGGAGLAISVTSTTKNQVGASPAPASTTKFYLSTNSTWDTGDMLLGSRAIPFLAAGASSSGAVLLTIPAGTATGNYYVIAKADGDDLIFETNETNNAKSASIRISPPDLVVSAISVPSIGGAGLKITATNTTKDQTNTGPAPASTTKFYLSPNATFDGSDPLIGSQTVTALNPGSSKSYSTTLTIPVGTSPGTYYVIAKADADNLIAETIETNNTASDTIVIGPDLIVSALIVPATGGAGMSIIVTDTTKNQGGGQAAASTTRFYLSTNSTLGSGDTLLNGNRSVGILNPAGTSRGQTTLTIPAGTPVGSYYIIAVADGPMTPTGSGVIPETVETNNTKAAPIKLSPDLIVSVLSAPTTAAAGASITITDTTKNQGQGVAGATTTSFYLSTNATYETGDTLLGSRPVLILAYNASSPGSMSVKIPAGTSPGTYYILARANATAAVAEANETNNVMSKVISITP